MWDTAPKGLVVNVAKVPGAGEAGELPTSCAFLFCTLHSTDKPNNHNQPINHLESKHAEDYYRHHLFFRMVRTIQMESKKQQCQNGDPGVAHGRYFWPDADFWDFELGTHSLGLQVTTPVVADH